MLLTDKDCSQLKINHVLGILREWARGQVNYKYHLNWINKLDTSSEESLYSSYKDNACGYCLDFTNQRIAYILLK